MTKSGTSEFHGSLFEFYRTSRFNARNFFLPKPSFTLAHNFGWTLGGPVEIPKVFKPHAGKLFFFVGQDYRRRTSPKQLNATIPTRAERSGIIESNSTFRYPQTFSVPELRGQPIEDPSRGTPSNPTGRNILPLRFQTANGQAMMKVYDAAEPLAAFYSDTRTPNNAIFNVPGTDQRREDIFRLDYNVTSNHLFTLRYLTDPVFEYNPVAQGDLPTVQANVDRVNRSIQVSHTWTPTATFISESAGQTLFYSFNRQFFGEYAFPKSVGLDLDELFGNEQDEFGFPAIAITGFTQIPGSRATPFGTSHDLSFRNNMSWLRGRHSMKFGGLFVRFYNRARIQSDLTGFIRFDAAGNVNTTGSSIMDTLLGNYQEYRETDVDRISDVRSFQFEGYVTDNWRISRRLTVDLGVRFYHIPPSFAIDNTVSTFDPGRARNPSLGPGSPASQAGGAAV